MPSASNLLLTFLSLFGGDGLAQGDPKAPPVAPPPATAGTAQATAVRRNTGANSFVLELDGQQQSLHRFNGTAQRLESQSGDGSAVRRSALPALRCEDFTVDAPLQLEPALAKWLGEALSGTAKLKDGSIQAIDVGGKSTIIHRLREMAIRSITLPKLDGASKEALDLRIVLGATSLKWEEGGEAQTAKVGAKSKSAMASNFRLKIDGINCDRVRSIGAIEAQFQIAAPSITGKERERSGSPTVRITPFQVEFAETSPKELVAWFDDTVAKGPAAARTVKIELLDATMKNVIATLSLDGATPSRLASIGSSDRESTAGFVLELGATSLKLDFPTK